jgi:hypothetical protein
LTQQEAADQEAPSNAPHQGADLCVSIVVANHFPLTNCMTQNLKQQIDFKQGIHRAIEDP